MDGSSTTTAEPTPVTCSPVDVVSGRAAVVVDVDSAVVLVPVLAVLEVLVVEVVVVVVVVGVAEEAASAVESLTPKGEEGTTGEVKWSTSFDTWIPITRVALISIADHGLSVVVGFSETVTATGLSEDGGN